MAIDPNQNINNTSFVNGNNTVKSTTITFNTSNGIFKSKYAVANNDYQKYGYNSDIHRNVMPNQVVTISSSSDLITIKALLQDDFSLAVHSDWEPFMSPPGAAEIGNAANQFMQLVTGAGASMFGTGGGETLVSPQSTKRVWKGSTPLKMVLPLKFIAFRDIEKEVMMPVGLLQRMVLPGGSLQFTTNVIYPPGPSYASFNNTTENGDIITIVVGNIFAYSPCIITDVKVSFDQRSDANGRPLSATADISFETYTMLTKDDLSNALHLTETNQPL